MSNTSTFHLNGFKFFLNKQKPRQLLWGNTGQSACNACSFLDAYANPHDDEPLLFATHGPPMLLKCTLDGYKVTDYPDQPPTTQPFVEALKSGSLIMHVTAWALGPINHEYAALHHIIGMRGGQIILEETLSSPVELYALKDSKVSIHTDTTSLNPYYVTENQELNQTTIVRVNPPTLYALDSKHKGNRPAVVQTWPPQAKTDLQGVIAVLDFYEKFQTDIENTPPPWEE